MLLLLLLLLLLLGLVEERFDGSVDDGRVDGGGHRSWSDSNVLVVEGEECIELVGAERSLEVTYCVCAFNTDLADEIDVVIAVVRTGKTAHDTVIICSSENDGGGGRTLITWQRFHLTCYWLLWANGAQCAVEVHAWHGCIVFALLEESRTKHILQCRK